MLLGCRDENERVQESILNMPIQNFELKMRISFYFIFLTSKFEWNRLRIRLWTCPFLSLLREEKKTESKGSMYYKSLAAFFFFKKRVIDSM